MEQYQEELHDDCVRLRQLFSQASTTIRDEGVSKYPIFVMHRQDELGVGINVVRREAAATHWSYQASTLEELVARRIVPFEELEAFRKIYKKPETHFCFMMPLTTEDDDDTLVPHFWFVPTRVSEPNY